VSGHHCRCTMDV